ncbi:sugar transporter [Sporothrix schenckii 1099-18]|uniref:Sugar transporter n=1 Tax=Sporothrix schenckii 1099-18 TaxID=1397361 RepID=A0A0F2M2Y8_SPOSC|nr:sugar transporter [Sporothrix schenckii 1099-18]KJR83459.1 sugar transporter [Sporothrix schenckii 1099-18]
MAGRGNVFVGKAAFKTATPRLLFICIVYAFGSVFFGYDSASFSGVQAFSPFLRQFGTYSAKKNAYALTTQNSALLNSLPLLGKLVGSLAVGPSVERYGHRVTMLGTCLIQIAGAVVQVTSTKTAQFVVGRLLVYLAVGFVENVVPTYQSEIAPGALRGFFVGSIQLCLTFGSLTAGLVNNAMAGRTDNTGWQIATAIQVVPPVLILLALPWTPLSPRWLVFQDREDEALAVLQAVRRPADVDAGVCALELAAMREDAARRCQDRRRTKGPWSDLVRGTNRRRTNIAVGLMSLQQLTGVTFSSSYGPTFYKSEGLGRMAFAYAAINNGVSVVTALLGMVVLDLFGRRSVTLHGCWTQGVFLALIGALGSKARPSPGETGGMVASFILYAAILHMSLGPAAYITAAEVGTGALREKTMAVATAVNVVVSFAVVYTTPYLLADLGAKLAYLWMAFAFAGAVYVWFVMPELTGRTLEEIDQLFESRIAAWRFAAFETTGLTHDVAAIEQGLAPSKLAGDLELVQVTNVARTGQMAEEGTEGTPAAPAPTAKGREDEI